jgi:hypothetical protein
MGAGLVQGNRGTGVVQVYRCTGGVWIIRLQVKYTCAGVQE